MIKNDEGHVAIRRYRQTGKLIKVHGNSYAFVVQHNVNLTWVRPEDVNAMVALKERACCGPKKKRGNVYGLANQIDVNVWLYGTRHGKEKKS